MCVDIISLGSVNISKGVSFCILKKSVKIITVMLELVPKDILEYVAITETTTGANLENGVILSMLSKVTSTRCILAAMLLKFIAKPNQSPS